MTANANVSDEGTVLACPNCDKGDYGVRAPSMKDLTDETASYYCFSCGTNFDDPVEREKRHPAVLHGMAGDLADANPDEVSR